MSPELRRFVRALRHVLKTEPDPENLHCKKIMKRLQIGPSRQMRGLVLLESKGRDMISYPFVKL